MRREDIARVRREVPVDWLLRHYGASFPYRGTTVVYSVWHAVRCPFHDDDAASGSYNLRVNRYKCHGPCAWSGSVIDLVMWREGFSKPGDAAEWLTSRYRR